MSDILSEVRGRLGLITLNRPAQLNALSLEMIQAITAALTQYESDTAIDAVALVGAGDRAFCAGGDVRALVAGDPQAAETLRSQFFAAEYRLNYLIHTSPKPVIAFMDGITMGGGCGLSLHASHRVATERTLVAMPETVLGFFPDVGATWFLGQLTTPTALYLGLTGNRQNAADCGRLGLANAYLPSNAVGTALDTLAQAGQLEPNDITDILERTGAPMPEDETLPARDDIAQHFSGDAFEDVLERITGAEEPWVVSARQTILAACPTSLRVTFRQMQMAQTLAIEDALALEYQLAIKMTRRLDFAEGVRAILIDKTNDPQWQPATLADIDLGAIDQLFAPEENRSEELNLPPGRSRV